MGVASIKYTGPVLQQIAAIDEFKGLWRAVGNLAPERLTFLRKIATVESVASSTRIEGVVLSDDEVERLIVGAKTTFDTRDEQEVAGYAAAMEMVFAGYDAMELTENHIKQLHQVLLSHSAKDERHRGAYKTIENHVEAFDAYGSSLGVVFQTASPIQTPGRMEALIRTTRANLELHHPLIAIAAFVVEFLAIHPFQDGNGRLSRVLTTLLLLRAGYAYVPFSSLERIIERQKDAYYIHLRRAQTEEEGGLESWIEFFVRCVWEQKQSLEERLKRERFIDPLPPLSEEILRIAREHGRVTVRSATEISQTSRNTVKDHIGRLLDRNLLARRGTGRGTFYTLLRE